MANNEPKQVIVVRSDLRNASGQKVRSGKLMAQCAHASLKAILDLGNIIKDYSDNDGSLIGVGWYIRLFQKMYRNTSQPEINHRAAIEWLEGRFTKVCVSVDSEQELLDVYQQAKDAGLICSLITDAGLTEFNGVPTNTVVAIGPAYPDEVNKITGHLKLL